MSPSESSFSDRPSFRVPHNADMPQAHQKTTSFEDLHMQAGR